MGAFLAHSIIMGNQVSILSDHCDVMYEQHARGDYAAIVETAGIEQLPNYSLMDGSHYADSDWVFIFKCRAVLGHALDQVGQTFAADLQYKLAAGKSAERARANVNAVMAGQPYTPDCEWKRREHTFECPARPN